MGEKANKNIHTSSEDLPISFITNSICCLYFQHCLAAFQQSIFNERSLNGCRLTSCFVPSDQNAPVNNLKAGIFVIPEHRYHHIQHQPSLKAAVGLKRRIYRKESTKQPTSNTSKACYPQSPRWEVALCQAWDWVELRMKGLIFNSYIWQQTGLQKNNCERGHKCLRPTSRDLTERSIESIYPFFLFPSTPSSSWVSLQVQIDGGFENNQKKPSDDAASRWNSGIGCDQGARDTGEPMLSLHTAW